MKVKEFQKKSITELNNNLLSLLREHFHLRMQNTNSQIKQTHLLKQVRRNIARVKTLLSEKMKH